MADFFTQVDQLPKTPDLLIIGGGVVGLWCAERALRQGLTTVLVDKRRIGEGASGGYLGALLPYQPINWNAKKQFQLDGLMSLESEIAVLEAATGLSCGYRRCGRVSPMGDERRRARNLGWSEDAYFVWPKTSPGGAPLNWTIEDTNPTPGWLADSEMPYGVSFDTLSARVAPRHLLAALKARICGNVHLTEYCPVIAIDGDGTAHLEGGMRLSPAKIILAAGYESGDLAGPLGGDAIAGIKGQSALLEPAAPISPDMPILYDEGLFVIVHDDGKVAVGSTTEKDWENAGTTDGALDSLVRRATALCPALHGARVVGSWTGVRPKGPTANPVIGPLHGAPGVLLCTAGYKISFGIAHKMADQAMNLV